jgi:hypothetical protein
MSLGDSIAPRGGGSAGVGAGVRLTRASPPARGSNWRCSHMKRHDGWLDPDVRRVRDRGRSGSEQHTVHQRNPGYSLTLPLSCGPQEKTSGIAGVTGGFSHKTVAEQPTELTAHSAGFVRRRAERAS